MEEEYEGNKNFLWEDLNVASFIYIHIFEYLHKENSTALQQVYNLML